MFSGWSPSSLSRRFARDDRDAAHWRRQRQGMVETQLMRRGIRDERVIAAMLAVPREQFVPAELREQAYEDRALPIGREQSISQPYVVALTLEALNLSGNETVLDVGTGSGYAAALLSCLAAQVHSVERLESLASEAKERLHRLGYAVEVHRRDGTLGLPQYAPYDAIAVAAGGPFVPPALSGQLALGGRMVIPIRHADTQMLVRVERRLDGSFDTEPLREVRFVPLIGAQGEPETTDAVLG
jgi:protein-L-isoaspartate(D-aspartate) O-methyltransferase